MIHTRAMTDLRYLVLYPAVLGVLSVFASFAWSVEYANIDVTFDGVSPNPPTVSIPGGQSTASFFLDSGAVLGEYPILIGAGAADDPANGVLLGYVRENGRDVSDTSGLPLFATASTVGDSDPTSTNTNARSDGLSLVVRRAGEADLGSAFPTNSPFAADLAAAYFPFSEGWMAGTASSSVNNGPINQFAGSPGLSLGTNFIVDGVGTNKHRLVLPGVTDSRRQGFLFVNHAKNEGNFALSEAADDGDGFVVVTHDNAADGSSTTVDPLSFVYIPLGTPNVTMARIHPSSGENLQPTAMQQSGLPFTITSVGATGLDSPGQYRLSIPGHSPSSGVLLVSPSTQGRDAGGAQTDNVVTYEADGNDWIILSQDLPALDGVGQFSRERISYFNFAFLPFSGGPTAPGSIQAPAWNPSRIVGWNAENIEKTPGNDTGEQYINVLQKTADVSVRALSENRGDNGFAIDGDFMIEQDGVLFATLTQGLRDNGATGGLNEYGVIGTGFFIPEWMVFTDAADPSAPIGEHNINFAAVFFGANSGFNPVAGAPTAGGNLEVVLPGVNSLNDGVLMGNAFGNDDNYALISPKLDGSGWDVEVHDDGTTLEADGVNYVYLPYDSQNLIAGRIDEDGTILSSTDTGEFTLTKDGLGTYRLSIPGKSPETGMLMLVGTGLNGSVDNTVVYESYPSGDDFKILGVDMITSDESALGALVDLEDTEFSFAYIDFDAPPIAPSVGLTGDYNDDGIVDAADYVVWRKNNINGQQGYDDWRDNFGKTSNGSGAGNAAVPEPSTGALLLLGLIVGLGCLGARRQHGMFFEKQFKNSPPLMRRVGGESFETCFSGE